MKIGVNVLRQVRVPLAEGTRVTVVAEVCIVETALAEARPKLPGRRERWLVASLSAFRGKKPTDRPNLHTTHIQLLWNHDKHSGKGRRSKTNSGDNG